MLMDCSGGATSKVKLIKNQMTKPQKGKRATEIISNISSSTHRPQAPPQATALATGSSTGSTNAATPLAHSLLPTHTLCIQMHCSAGRLGPQLLLQRASTRIAVCSHLLLPHRRLCGNSNVEATSTAGSVVCRAQQQDQQQELVAQEAAGQQQQMSAVVQQDGHADAVAAAPANGTSSSSSIKKKVKRNVALHVGYVGTQYTGECSRRWFGRV